VHLVREADSALRPVALRDGERDAGDESSRASGACPACNAACERGERLVIEDADAEGVEPSVRDAARRDGWRAMYATPLCGVSGGAIGVVATRFRKRRQWTERNLRMLDLFASIAGEAIASRLSEQALRAEQARQAFLVALGDVLRPLHDAQAVQVQASRVLREHLGADVVVYSEAVGSDTVTPTAVDRAPWRTAMSGLHRLSDFGPMLVDEFLRGHVTSRSDVSADSELTGAQKAACAEIGVNAWANAPLVKDGRLVAMLTIVFETAHDWSRDELRLLQDVAERTWSAAERARAESALAQSEARFRLLFDSIDQGFCTIQMLFDAHDKPVDYRFLEVNPAFVKQTGVADAAGRRAGELVPELEPFWAETYGRIARTGNPERFDHVAASIGKWFDVYAFRLGDPSLQQLGVLFADIGERKRAEEALRTSEARLRAALVAGNMATWSWDPATDRLTASDTLSEVFGLRSGEAIERTADGMRLIHPDDVERHRAKVQEAIRTGGSWHSEFRIVRPRDGRVAWLEERALALRDLVSGELRLDGLVWDITERKEAQAALIEADEAKNRFLAVVSHELKNPLNLIQLNAELLSKLPEARTQPVISRAADALRKAVHGLAALVDDLLDLSRLNTGKLTFRPSVIDLGHLIPSIIASVKPQARARGIAIAADIEGDCWVNADVTRIEQVIWNLLSNAMKFTPSGGRVDVRLEVDGAQAKLEVSDTGQGIEPEALARIFELFVQEDRESSRSKGGLGIGLALVKQIAELHGGRVEARSAGTGMGATFTLTLPLAPATMAKAADPTEPHAPRLLLVEDEADSADALRQLLGLEGYAVDVAQDGQEGWAKATGDGRPYDLVVSDIGMPNLDGLRFIRALRAHPKTAAIAAVALTGYAREGDIGSMVEAGFDDVVAKPVRMEALLHAVKRALLKRAAPADSA
jgi:PAS domain S-box-containing protein